jgi:hypothetical protein
MIDHLVSCLGNEEIESCPMFVEFTVSRARLTMRN